MQAITICDHFFDPDGDEPHLDLNASTTTFHCSLNTVGSSDSCFRYMPLPAFWASILCILLCVMRDTARLFRINCCKYMSAQAAVLLLLP